MRILIGVFLIELWISSAATAGDMEFHTPEYETYLYGGSPSRCVDVVFLAEGYRRWELARFRSDVSKCIARLFEVNPFRDRKKQFNVYGVLVISRDSGGDHSDLGIFRNTAFDSYYDGRLLRIENWENLSLAKAKAPAADVAVVLVNDRTYGGAGYSGTATAYNGSRGPEVAIHELGHSFGGLADEYAGTSAYAGEEPAAPNATMQSDASRVKWRDLVGFNGVSTFQGGMTHYRYGIWRPTRDGCQMRTLGNPFCNVCIRGLNRKIGICVGSFAPEAFAKADVVLGRAPFMVRFTGHATDRDSRRLRFLWDFGDDDPAKGPRPTSQPTDDRNPIHVFHRPGTYRVLLRVVDERGQVATAFPILVEVRKTYIGLPSGSTISTPWVARKLRNPLS